MAAVAVGLGSTAVTLPIFVAVGGGAAVGGLLGRMIYRNHAKRLQEQLERGGLLLWVNVRNPEEERRAIRILKTHAGRHVHAHELAA